MTTFFQLSTGLVASTKDEIKYNLDNIIGHIVNGDEFFKGISGAVIFSDKESVFATNIQFRASDVICTWNIE